MASAVIVIDQPNNPNPNGLPGRSRDDIILGELVQLSNNNDTGVRQHFWEILDQPDLAAPDILSNPLAPTPTFTPNALGTYRIRLRVNEGRLGEEQIRLVAVRDISGVRYPAAGEQTEANWIDQDTLAPNERGWWPDFRSLVQAAGSPVFDNRNSPIVSGVIPPATFFDFEIDTGFPEPVMTFFRIDVTIGTTATIALYADAARTISVLFVNLHNFQLSGPYINNTLTALYTSTGGSAVSLENNTVYGRITNNVLPTSFSVEMVVRV